MPSQASDESGPRVRGVRTAARSLLAHPARFLLTISGIGLATALLASTLAFQWGYEASLERSIDSLGFRVLVTGKGSPHEAATLMLRGGAIPMYIQEQVAAHILTWAEIYAPEGGFVHGDACLVQRLENLPVDARVFVREGEPRRPAVKP